MGRDGSTLSPAGQAGIPSIKIVKNERRVSRRGDASPLALPHMPDNSLDHDFDLLVPSGRGRLGGWRGQRRVGGRAEGAGQLAAVGNYFGRTAKPDSLPRQGSGRGRRSGTRCRRCQVSQSETEVSQNETPSSAYTLFYAFWSIFNPFG